MLWLAAAILSSSDEVLQPYIPYAPGPSLKFSLPAYRTVAENEMFDYQTWVEDEDIIQVRGMTETKTYFNGQLRVWANLTAGASMIGTSAGGQRLVKTVVGRADDVEVDTLCVDSYTFIDTGPIEQREKRLRFDQLTRIRNVAGSKPIKFGMEDGRTNPKDNRAWLLAYRPVKRAYLEARGAPPIHLARVELAAVAIRTLSPDDQDQLFANLSHRRRIEVKGAELARAAREYSKFRKGIISDPIIRRHFDTIDPQGRTWIIVGANGEASVERETTGHAMGAIRLRY